MRALLCSPVALLACKLAAVEPHSSSELVLPLVWIQPGSFRMGDLEGDGQSDEQPVRQVRVAGFWIMPTEVTVDMFRRFTEATGYAVEPGCWVYQERWALQPELDWRSPGFGQAADHPVTCVSWHDASAYAAWMRATTGRPYSLPSEAQWEYAARAGAGSPYQHGDEPAGLCAQGNGADLSALRDYPGFAVNDCDDGYTRTAPVGRFESNAWGLYDIHGNVWEWVADCWHDSYTDAPLTGAPRIDGSCERRGYRGGGYGDIPAFLRLSLRNRAPPSQRKDDIGFRLVVDGPGVSR